MGAVNSWWQGDEAFSLQSEQEFPASHVLETAVGLHPIPFFAEDFGNLGTTFMPMLRNGSLNQGNIGFGDGPFSDGNGQHSNCISELNRRRQKKYASE